MHFRNGSLNAWASQEILNPNAEFVGGAGTGYIQRNRKTAVFFCHFSPGMKRFDQIIQEPYSRSSQSECQLKNTNCRCSKEYETLCMGNKHAEYVYIHLLNIFTARKKPRLPANYYPSVKGGKILGCQFKPWSRATIVSSTFKLFYWIIIIQKVVWSIFLRIRKCIRLNN